VRSFEYGDHSFRTLRSTRHQRSPSRGRGRDPVTPARSSTRPLSSPTRRTTSAARAAPRTCAGSRGRLEPVRAFDWGLCAQSAECSCYRCGAGIDLSGPASWWTYDSARGREAFVRSQPRSPGAVFCWNCDQDLGRGAALRRPEPMRVQRGGRRRRTNSAITAAISKSTIRPLPARAASSDIGTRASSRERARKIPVHYTSDLLRVCYRRPGGTQFSLPSCRLLSDGRG
jgi:hypothetical protein